MGRAYMLFARDMSFLEPDVVPAFWLIGVVQQRPSHPEVGP